ncbi:MAG: DMT family transporter, partial [Verrucomicrobiota bacterium]|nr:DMT family transporter [Verrucomicrobiota bacterium]
HIEVWLAKLACDCQFFHVGDRRQNIIIAASLVLATVVWGANNTTIGYLVRDWPVLWTTGTRLFFAGLLLLGLLRWTKLFDEPKPVPPDVHRRLWLRGAPLFMGWAAGFSWAVTMTPVSHASLYLAASPVWGLLLEERPRLNRESLRKYFAALLALAGIVVLFWPKLNTDAGDGHKWLGDVIAFCASWSWTLYSRESSELSKRVSGMLYTAQTAWRAGLLLLPFVIWEITKNPPALESHLIGWQVFSIFAGTIVGLGIWNHVLRYWPASRALLFNNLIPVFAMFWAWKFIDEKITPTFWPAMALVVAGVVVGLAPWRK